MMHFCDLVSPIKPLSNNEREFVDDFNRKHGDSKPEVFRDEAWMTFNSTVTFNLQLYMLNHECWKVGRDFSHCVSRFTT